MTADNAIALIGIIVGVLTVGLGALSAFLLSIDRKVNRLETREEGRTADLRKVEKRQDRFESTMQSLTDFLMMRGRRSQRPETDSDEADTGKETRPW